MLVVSAAPSDTAPVESPAGIGDGHGTPCVFSGCAGFFHPAGGTTGVVLCAPWGFEELTMRKSWRLLAEAIAAAGYPCLRFDYPGTGDSLGRATDPSSYEGWVAAINAGADFVRRVSGVRRFVFVGQTLGATLAVEAARTRGDVAGLHLIAPVVKGRAHVRELAATSRLVADKLGIAPDLVVKEGLSVMGFAMSIPMVESLKSLDLTKIDAPGVAQGMVPNVVVPNVVVYDQIDRKAAAEIVEHLRKLGATVDVETVEPYHLMVSDATAIQPLPVSPERLVARLRAAHPIVVANGSTRAPLMNRVLSGDTFREDPIHFGPDDSLFGILCRPHQARDDLPAVVLLNRGLNPHTGWRRVSVDHARGLAAAGITSLRIDAAGLGESRDEAGRPQNLIYSDLLIPDIKAAVDVLAGQGHSRIMLAGVCSGAYMALGAAQADPRVTDLVVVNAQRFVWNPKESFEDVIRFGLRSVQDYVGDIKSGSALRKLFRSRRRIAPAMVFLAKRNAKNAMARVPLRLRSILMRGSMAARVDKVFATFAARGTRVSLVFTTGDPGLTELRTYFGVAGRNLRNPRVSVTIVPNADHNLTTNAASDAMLDHMIDVAREGLVRDDARPAARQARGRHNAVCPT